MTCPTELELSIYADGELPAPEAAAIGAHARACHACAARLEMLRREVGVLRDSLSEEEVYVDVPVFEPPAGAAGTLTVTAVLLLAATAIAAYAPRLLDLSLPEPLAWLGPFGEADLVNLAVHAAIFVVQQGGRLLASAAEAAALVTVLALAGWIVWRLAGAAKRNGQGPLMLMSVCALAVLAPEPSEALEIRRSDSGSIVVPAGETIADTLIVVSENVEIAGDVEGDLIAIGRRVTIRGNVGGFVITAGREVTIGGQVNGSVIGFAETLELISARLGRNLFGFGNRIRAAETASIDGNAVVFAQRANLLGPVGSDVLGFGEEVEVGNTVGGGITAYANRLMLLAPARVSGNVLAHLPAEDHLTVAPGAEIAGSVDTDIIERPEEDREFISAGYYLGQLLRFAAAFVTGLIVLALVPGLRRLSVDTVGEVLTAGAVGIVTLVAAPILAVLVMLTIVGLPLGLLGLLLWLAGLYLAKIVVAYFVGSRLLERSGRRGQLALSLAIGLLLVLIVVSLPFVGGLLNFVLTACGLGVLGLYVWGAFRPAAR